MKSFILLMVTGIYWMSFQFVFAQENNWTRVDSKAQMLEIRGPAITVVSHTYLEDISLIQAEISRMNALRDKPILLYEIDVAKLDRDESDLMVESEQYRSLPEILVYNNGKWIPIKFFGQMQAFFRKNPLKDAPRFHREIAESAFEHVREQTK